MQINCDEFSDTEYVLVDPSCSGSGIINRLSYHQVRVASGKLEVMLIDSTVFMISYGPPRVVASLLVRFLH